MNKMIADELIKNGVMGLFLLILLYFAREVLTNVKDFLKEAKADKKTDIDLSRTMITDLTAEIKLLNSKIYDDLKLTQGQLIDAVAGNALAIDRLAEGLMTIAKGSESISQLINKQNLILNSFDVKASTKTSGEK